MKHLILITGFIFFISSCELTQDNVFHQLHDKYKTTLKDKDTMLFKSNNVVDTIVVRKIANVNYQYALSGTSCKEPYEYWEFECLFFFKLNEFDSDSCLKYYFNNNIQKYGECESSLPECAHAIRIYYGISGIYLPNIKLDGGYYICTDTISSIIINNTKFETVYQYKPKENTSKYSEIYINHQKGILKYVFDSLTYELINHK